MKINYQDRIDEYLLNRMSGEERLAFEKEINADKELQEQLSFTEDVQRIMKSRNEKLAKMEEWKDDYKWDETRSSGRKILYWISGIAAVFVAVVFLIKIPHYIDGYMASTRMSDTSLRAGSDNSDIELLINQKKYDEALDLIEEKSLALKADSLELVQDIAINSERKEYDLQIVKDKQDKLKWFKVHALLGLHRQGDALLLLDELRNAEGGYQLSADSLYKKLTKK